MLGFARAPFQHMEKGVHELVVPPEFYDDGFAVLRDPLDRLLSAFKFRSLWQANLDPTVVVPVDGADDWRLRMERRLESPGRSGPNVTLVGQPLSFNDWVPRIFEDFQSDPHVLDNHIRPQQHFTLRSHWWFLFEDGISPVLDWIDDWAGVTVERESQPANATPGTSPMVSNDVAQMVRDFYRDDYGMRNWLRGQPGKPAKSKTT
jgi:hypothetical protein